MRNGEPNSSPSSDPPGARAHTAADDEGFHRSLSDVFGPSLILSILPGAMLIGLLSDRDTEPRWAMHLGAAIAGGLVVAAQLAALPRRRPAFVVGPRGLTAPDTLARTLPWEDIERIRATRHEPVGKNLPGYWALQVHTRSSEEYRKRRGSKPDGSNGVIDLTLTAARPGAKGSTRGADVLRSIERFRPVERQLAGEAVRLAPETSAPAKERPREPAVFRASGLAVWRVRIVALVLVAIAVSLLIDHPDSLGGPLLALLCLAGASWMFVSLQLWKRRVEARVEADGLYLRDRTLRPIPWSAITHVELAFDPTPVGRYGGVAGWLIRIAVDDPAPYVAPRMLARIAKDGALVAEVSSITPEARSAAPKALADAIAPFAPVSFRQ